MTNKYINTLFVILITFSLTLAQEKGTITGIVADSSGQESLLGVNINCGQVNITSDYIEGKYTLELLAGEHQLTFSYLGYASVVKNVTIVAGKNGLL